MFDKLKTKASLGLFLGAGASVHAATTLNVTHYAPANTSNTVLKEVLNGTGAPGIYNTSVTPDDSYGTYNWCSMPHVRKNEYKVPDKEYELQYVEVIQRHHKRTPYASNTFFKEDISWDCSDSGPYANAKAKDFETAQVYWQSQVDTQNPFEYTVGPGFVNSTCRFPGITTEGLDDAKVHGEDLRGVYGDLLQLLPLSNEREKYQWRVTNNIITSQTLGGLAKGLFPDVEEYYALIQSSVYDSLEPSFSCDLASTIKSQQTSTPEWEDHLNQTAELRSKLNQISGIESNDTGGWKDSWDHYYDNMSAKQCHGKTLPCSTNDTSVCATQEMADEVYRLGQWEYAYWWRGNENSTLRAVLTMGPWFRELQSHLKDAVDGNNQIKYYHNFAHDGSIGPTLGILQLDEPVWPGMGSEVVFELWKKDSESYIRVLWSGQPIKTSGPLGTIDMVKLEDFNAYIDDLLPKDFVAACEEK